MRIELTEVLWLDEHHELSLPELAELSGLPEAVLQELVDYGIIVPADTDAKPQTFHADCVAIARTACRLRNDFQLDTQGLTLAMTLLDRVHELEQRLHNLNAQLPRWLR